MPRLDERPRQPGYQGVSERGSLAPAQVQRIFRLLLTAFSEPGRLVQLPDEPGVPTYLLPVLALANSQLPIAVVDRDGSGARLVTGFTGTPTAPPTEARLVAVAQPVEPALLQRLPIGTAESPELAALVVLAARSIGAEGVGPLTLRLRGPGVPDERKLTVDGIPRRAFEVIAERNRDAPRGLDVLLVADGEVLAVPRTCSLSPIGHG